MILGLSLHTFFSGSKGGSHSTSQLKLYLSAQSGPEPSTPPQAAFSMQFRGSTPCSQDTGAASEAGQQGAVRNVGKGKAGAKGKAKGKGKRNPPPPPIPEAQVEDAEPTKVRNFIICEPLQGRLIDWVWVG